MRLRLVSLSTAAGVSLVASVTTALLATGGGSGARVEAAVRTTTTTTAASATQPRATSGTTDPTLTATIRDRMRRSTAGTWAAVVDVAGAGRVVDVNGTLRLLPASTEKLFTTLPLLRRRPTVRLVTTIGALAAPAGGVLAGDLVIKASGDPTVTRTTLKHLAAAVHDAGVRKVTGRLVLDIGSLPSTRTRSGWKSSYVPSDIGPLSPFPVSADVWRTTSAYVSHPTQSNLALFRTTLKAAGVKVVGASAIVRGARIDTVLAQRQSPTLASIIRRTLLVSDNFRAEQLLSIEGFSAVNGESRTAGSGGSTTDGSGLSLRDRRSAADEVALLEFARDSAAGSRLMRSLPVACRSGTLEHEMCGTSVAGKVFAKTGTLNYVKTLAGFTTDAKGRMVTFAFLTSGVRSWYKAMNAIERSVIAVHHYAG